MYPMIQGILNALFVGGNTSIGGLALHQRTLYGRMVDDDAHVLGEYRVLQ